MTEKLFDRRRRKRIDVSLPVILENATAVTRDASASGVFFWKRGTFMYGDFIRFAIERSTDSGKVLQKCRGIVVRTEPDDNGVGVAAKITESKTERVPGQPPGPELPHPAREEPPAIAPPAENTPATAEKTVEAEAAQEEPPTIARPADDAPDPDGERGPLEAAHDEAPTIAWPTAEALFLPDKTVQREAVREQLPTIAWPTDESFFSPDKTISLHATHEQLRTDAKTSSSEPAPADEADSLDFVHEQPVTIAQQRVDALASAIPTINRWSSLLRGMALDAREELQGQEVLEWSIPPAADARIAQSSRLTVCSVTVVGLCPGESRTPGSGRFPGVSYRDLARLRASSGSEARRLTRGAGVNMDTRVMNQGNPPDAHGLRIELAISTANLSSGDPAAGKVLLPGIVVRITSVPDDRQHGGETYCYEETSYGDPREAFEAFMRLAGESAILVNLAVLHT